MMLFGYTVCYEKMHDHITASTSTNDQPDRTFKIESSLPVLVVEQEQQPQLKLNPTTSLSSLRTHDATVTVTAITPQQSQTAGPKTKEWPNWPAIAYEEVGHPLVTKGESFFNQARKLYFQQQPNGKTLMDEFIEVYKNRPDPVNMGSIRINHALALFLAVKRIQPSLVVESGVNAGVSTYFIRAASSTTKIFICSKGTRWIDPSDKTINYTGDNFIDLLDLDWVGMSRTREIDLENTLVFIDDHLHAYKRIAGVMKYGVRHIVVEDNYKLNEGVCDCVIV